MMQYTNYLTTPSGRYCQVRDINNEQYLILVKFLQAENYRNFFKCLNQIVKKSIPDFESFDVVQKCYVYIAMCMYSIRGSISVNNKMIGNQEIPIALILNNIESQYIPNLTIQYQIFDGYVLQFGYPTQFNFQGQTPIVDFYSGLRSMNGKTLKQEQKIALKNKLGTKNLSFIDDILRQKMSTKSNIFQGVPMNNFQINIVSESLISNVVGFYKMNQQSMYQIMYTMIKHLRMSYSDFMKISFLESTILMNICAQENKKIAQESKGKGSIALNQLND